MARFYGEDAYLQRVIVNAVAVVCARMKKECKNSLTVPLKL